MPDDIDLGNTQDFAKNENDTTESGSATSQAAENTKDTTGSDPSTSPTTSSQASENADDVTGS